MSAVLAAGRVASLGAQSPVSAAGTHVWRFGHVQLRSHERLINRQQRKSSTAILDGQGLPLVRPELANGGGGKRKFEKGREGPMAALTILNSTTENSISPHLLRKCW